MNNKAARMCLDHKSSYIYWTDKKELFTDILHTMDVRTLFRGPALSESTRRLNMSDSDNITSQTNKNNHKNMPGCVYIDVWKPVWLTD